MNENSTIAFFDFDGTITNRDIFWDYLFFRLKKGLSLFKVIYCVPEFVLYLLKVLNNEKAKQLIFSKLFKGESIDFFNTTVNRYYASAFPGKVRKDASDRILWHKNSNHKVCIVSANFDLILHKFAVENTIEYISTELQVENNILTGKFKTPNCYGQEKVNRIRNKYPNINSYSHIFAYGDSKGDTEMLALATNPHYRFFNK